MHYVIKVDSRCFAVAREKSGSGSEADQPHGQGPRIPAKLIIPFKPHLNEENGTLPKFVMYIDT